MLKLDWIIKIVLTNKSSINLIILFILVEKLNLLEDQLMQVVGGFIWVS